MNGVKVIEKQIVNIDRIDHVSGEISCTLDPMESKAKEHKFVLQYHMGDGGWVNVCVKCGKRDKVNPRLRPPGFDPTEDSIKWMGQPNRYELEFDCETGTRKRTCHLVITEDL